MSAVQERAAMTTPTIPKHGMEGDAGREAAPKRFSLEEREARFRADVAENKWATTFTSNALRIIDHHASRADRAEAALREAREALAVIEGGYVPSAANMVLSGDWHGFATVLQEIARAALGKMESNQ